MRIFHLSKKEKPKTRGGFLSKFDGINAVNTFLFCCIFFVAVTVIINSGKYMTSALNGLKMYVVCVLPALLPFFLLTAILSRLQTPPLFTKVARPFTEKMLGLCGDTFTLILVSFMSGNPVGAKLIAEYEKKQTITKKQLVTMCAICSMTSPVFIVSTIGVKFFGDIKIGYFLLVIQLISSLLNGFVYKSQISSPIDTLTKHIKKSTDAQKGKNTGKPSLLIISDSVTSCVSSTLLVGAYITLFYLFTDILIDVGIVDLLAKPIALLLSQTGYGYELSTPIVLSFFEVTRGTKAIALLDIPLNIRAVACCTMLSFSGLSIIMQSCAFLPTNELPFKKILVTKLTHMVISLALSSLTFAIFF